MNQDLVDRIRQCPTLPTLPSIALQVLELAQNPAGDVGEIARLISQDSALTGKILRTVNSSFYARSHPVATISHALVMLGLQAVKTLVLGFSLVNNVAQPREGKGGKGFNYTDYWKRSIYSATAARALAAKTDLVQQEEAFLAALLKEIGMLALDQVLGPAYAEVYESAPSHEALSPIEHQRLGLTHAEAGGLLTAQWKLPPLLVVPIAHHHTPHAVTDPQLRKFAELVHLSGRCADVFIDEVAAGAIADVRKMCQDGHGMGGSEADALLHEVGRKTKEVAGLFEVSIGDPADYQSILRRANEALVEITLHSQQQAASLSSSPPLSFRQPPIAASTGGPLPTGAPSPNPPSLANAASLAGAPSSANGPSPAAPSSSAAQRGVATLRPPGATDPLTGLATRAALDAYLAERYNAASGTGAALSLLMLDVDGLAGINERLGRPAGDETLRVLGQLLGAAARVHDLAGRYGGEELALVLPNTPRAAAAAIAESVRRAVAAHSFGPHRPPATVSVGVASVERGAEAESAAIRSPVHLLKAAELAVQAAKRAGRNCVRIFTMNKPAGGASRPAA